MAVRKSDTLLLMLFTVIEHFRSKHVVRERFQRQGRMLPDKVAYQASSIDSRSDAYYQVIGAPHRQALTPWIGPGNDIIDFEVTCVMASPEFWERVGPEDPRVAALE